MDWIEHTYLALAWWGLEAMVAISLAALMGGTVLGWVGGLLRIREGLLAPVGRAAALAGACWWWGPAHWLALQQIVPELWRSGLQTSGV